MDSTWSRLEPSLTARPASGGVQRRWRLHAALALLLAVSVATLVVVADRAISTWTDGHLFLAWLAGWAVIFAATALLDSWHRHRTAARAAAAQAASRRRVVLPLCEPDTPFLRSAEPAQGHSDGHRHRH